MSDDLPIGAHLRSPRRGYTHHGLYAGGGRVIHYAGFNRAFRRGPVEEVSLERFTRGWALAVGSTVAPRFLGSAALERARSRLGEDQYSVWSNNCEHFVEWCLHGTARSAQIDRWLSPLRQGLRVLAGAGAATATVGRPHQRAT